MIHEYLQEINRYCDEMSNKGSDLLYQLLRETHLKTLSPRMASGDAQGRVLSMLSKMKRPQRILEIGTFTGYATICLAEGLSGTGTITTIEINPELNWLAIKYFKLAGIEDQVNAKIGDALEIIPELEEKYDLVFIDAAKKNYEAYFDLIIDKMTPGGIIIADNVLWDGHVLDPEPSTDTIKAIQRFNKKVRDDERVTTVMLPLRDGLTLMMCK